MRPEWVGCTQGEKNVTRGFDGSSNSGLSARRFRANIVPAEWLANAMCLMFRCCRSSGMVSRKIGIRSFNGTGVEPPIPGLSLY